jgi:hypothetical protein
MSGSTKSYSASSGSSSGGVSAGTSAARQSPASNVVTASPGSPSGATPAGKSQSMGFSDPKRGTPTQATPAGKSYSLGSGSATSSKPSGESFNPALARAAAVEESRVRFQQANAPKAAYTDAQGSQHRIDPADQGVQTLRRQVTPEQYTHRTERAGDFFGTQYRNIPVVQYHDPFGPFFYLWLLDRCTSNDRAEWAYHHRAQMDQARWADMVRGDAQLEARVRQLEAERRPVDPAYVPAALKNNPDLMYNDAYVTAAWNPQPAQLPPQRPGFPWGTMLVCLLLLGGVALVIWIIRKQSAAHPKETVPLSSNENRDSPHALYNPLNIACGSLVTVDELDFRGKDYRVTDIQEYDHELGGKHFKLVDYVLHAEKEVVRVRAVPGEGRCKAMLLTLYDDLAYNKDLHNTVRDDTGKFVVDDAEAGLHEEYWRVEDVKTSYQASVTTLHGEGKGAAPQTSHSRIEYWDYWRDTELDGVKVTQYLYVEMNAETGWFQIWRGMETDPERILAV